MPGFNGTGPRGMGPMTGGGRGFCNPGGIRATYRPYGRGRGMGYGFRGYGYGVSPVVSGMDTFNPPMSGQQEIDSLKEQARELKSRLEQVESRIDQLGSQA